MSNVRHYPRVSSKKQAEQGDSVEFQEKRLRDNSKNNNDNIIGVHTDAGKSASISDDKIKIWHDEDGFFWAKIDIRKRKGLLEILDLLTCDDWEILEVTKWDRFSRNSIVTQLLFLYFKDYDKKIVAIDDSNDSLVRDILAILGQKEIEKMVTRIREVRQMRFDKGIMVARSPFGYKPIYKDKKIIGFKINKKEADIVRKCFEMTSVGEKYSEICRETKLKPQQFYNIIRNKVYCGYIQFEGQEKKGTHPSIISPETWEKCQSQ